MLSLLPEGSSQGLIWFQIHLLLPCRGWEFVIKDGPHRVPLGKFVQVQPPFGQNNLLDRPSTPYILFPPVLSGWVFILLLVLYLLHLINLLCVFIARLIVMRFLSFAAATGLLSVVTAQADQVGN